MRGSRLRTWVKSALGYVPLAPEIYQRSRRNGGAPAGGYRADRLAQALPQWASALPSRAPDGGRRALVVSYLVWWLEHSSALAMLLASQGHRVDLAFLPYRTWQDPWNLFDARSQAAYLSDVLGGARGRIHAVDLLRLGQRRVPPDLDQTLQHQSLLDVQYTLQKEDLDLDSPTEGRLFQLRLRRNRHAAGAVLGLLSSGRYSVVIVPNGSVLEFAAAFHAARHAKIPVVTYEFGEQRERMWLARDSQVMRQDTAPLWTAGGSVPLTEAEEARVRELYRARRGGQRWENFSRQWQTGVNRGAAATRESLQLKADAPLVLVCTNVVGDSLALDRQVFTRGMADWLSRTVQHLAARPEVQVVVRVHPGELLGAGQPSAEIVERSLPKLGHRVRVVPPESTVNTYDLMELTHVGVVYTSTVGMELAMGGVPVIVAGETHYRGKGFTDDPLTWGEYVSTLDRRLLEPPGRRLTPERVELAWRYAYRFFFEYPRAFPWHLIGFWDDMAARPMESVVQPRMMEHYQATVEALMASSGAAA